MTPARFSWRTLVRALVAHPKSRRAVDETWADVDAERPRSGAAARARWCLQTTFAVLRVLARAWPAEVTAAGLGLAGRATLTIGGITMFFMAGPATEQWHAIARRSDSLVASATTILLIPQALVIGVPIGAFLAVLFSRKRQSVPVIAAASLFAVLTCAAVTAVPVANQRFRQVWFAIAQGEPVGWRTVFASQPRSASVPVWRGTPEMSLTELGRAGFFTADDSTAGSEMARARQAFLTRTSFAPWAFAAILLAGAVANGGRRYRWIVAPTVVLGSFGLLASISEAWGLWLATVMMLAVFVWMEGSVGEAASCNSEERLG